MMVRAKKIWNEHTNFEQQQKMEIVVVGIGNGVVEQNPCMLLPKRTNTIFRLESAESVGIWHERLVAMFCNKMKEKVEWNTTIRSLIHTSTSGTK